MPTSLRVIGEMLHNRDLCHRVESKNGFVVIKLPTKKYTNSSDKHDIQLVVKVEENGEFIRCIAPYAYTNSQRQHEMTILQTCMHITRDEELIQCCFDDSTGEICIQVEIFIGESPLSERQLIKSLFCIVTTVDSYDEAFRSAIHSGTFSYRKIYSNRIKLATLAKKLFDVSTDNLDPILDMLEGVNVANISENKKKIRLH